MFVIFLGTKNNLKIRENRNNGIYVEGASEFFVASVEEVFSILTLGSANRATAETSIFIFLFFIFYFFIIFYFIIIFYYLFFIIGDGYNVVMGDNDNDIKMICFDYFVVF